MKDLNNTVGKERILLVLGLVIARLYELVTEDSQGQESARSGNLKVDKGLIAKY
jgi:hypothetical protein